jgi:hypothetical protein
MTNTLTHYLATALTPAGVIVAQVSSNVFDEAGVGSAILLTVAGIALRVYLPRHQMSAEERVKDGKMTDKEARRQMTFYRRCAAVASLVGVAVLFVVLFDLAR